VFYKSSPQIKEKVYFALVRSKLEFSTSAWDPYRQTQIDKLEMVQRRAARFVLNDFSLTSSVTEMISALKWEFLADRRKFARLKNFYPTLLGGGLT